MTNCFSISLQQQRRLPGRTVRAGAFAGHLYQFRDQDEQDQLRAVTDAIHFAFEPIRISAPKIVICILQPFGGPHRIVALAINLFMFSIFFKLFFQYFQTFWPVHYHKNDQDQLQVDKIFIKQKGK